MRKAFAEGAETENCERCSFSYEEEIEMFGKRRASERVYLWERHLRALGDCTAFPAQRTRQSRGRGLITMACTQGDPPIFHMHCLPDYHCANTGLFYAQTKHQSCTAPCGQTYTKRIFICTLTLSLIQQWFLAQRTFIRMYECGLFVLMRPLSATAGA